MSAFADRYDFRDPGLFSDRDFVYIILFYKFPQEKFCGGFTVNNYRQEVIFVKADGKNNRGIASKTIRTG